jgi:ribosomal protein S18 acetylase RimI-like enzyme
MTAAEIVQVIKIERNHNLAPRQAADYYFELKNENSLVLTARLKNTVVGFISVRLIMSNASRMDDFTNSNPNTQLKDIEIHNFAVAKMHQNRGIGSQLLMKVAEITKPCKIWLEVRKTNESAKRFYLARGFRVIGERKNYYLNPIEDALLLEYETPRQQLKNNNPGV